VVCLGERDDFFAKGSNMAASSQPPPDDKQFLPREQFGALIETLVGDGYTVIGPTVRDNVVRLGPINSLDQLPHGLRDAQDGGYYRLDEGDPALCFEYVVGPDGPKRYLFPPKQDLFKLHIEGEAFVIDATAPNPPRYALLGLRPCDLAAIGVHDKVFDFGDGSEGFRCEAETHYCEARRNCLVIAVNCTRPGGTCFCVSMGTGPEALDGYDIAMTELRGGLMLRAGSDDGRALLAKLPVREPTAAERELEDLKLIHAIDRMGRTMDIRGIVELLNFKVDHSHYNEVAARCLGCGNCTMVCPTCFCSTVTDSTDLATGAATRTRQWESCYSHQFSYTVGGSVRTSKRARYRHWLRHKLGTWWEQFGTSGCVGCGRCITWCPVGIDITEEAAAIRGDWQPGDPAPVQSEVN